MVKKVACSEPEQGEGLVMTGPDREERREDRRNSTRGRLPLSVQGPAGNFFDGTGLVGVSGCYCLLPSPMTPGGRVNMQVCLQPGPILELPGRILRVAPKGERFATVIQFEELPFDSERALARWLDHHGQGFVQ